MTALIRTPDQRLRVFVSSTLQELADERVVTKEAIQSIRLTPVMFETGARPHPPRDLYRAYLAQSDVFIGIYWQRYGWIAPNETVSGLEDEYLLAQQMPKLIYIKRVDTREELLKDLIHRIEDEDKVSYRPFSDAGELKDLRNVMSAPGAALHELISGRRRAAAVGDGELLAVVQRATTAPLLESRSWHCRTAASRLRQGAIRHKSGEALSRTAV